MDREKLVGEKFREGRMEVAFELWIEQVQFLRLQQTPTEIPTVIREAISELKIDSRIVLSAEVFLNLGGTTDMYVRPGRLAQGVFLSVLDNLYIQEESVMEKKYDFQKAEKALEKMWQENEIYRYQNGKERKIFSIDTPPPTVSGKLHIGHVFSYTQAEMIARFKRMQGYDVFYPFVFDDNGLTTERQVERDEKIRANQMPRSEFRAKCMKTIGTYEGEFKELWSRLGFSV